MSEIRYCKRCKRATIQNKEYDTNAFERVFAGIFTIGFHELIVKRWWRCAECNTVNGEHDLLDKI